MGFPQSLSGEATQATSFDRCGDCGGFPQSLPGEATQAASFDRCSKWRDFGLLPQELSGGLYHQGIIGHSKAFVSKQLTKQLSN
ncbi:hypothetical protein [Brasilonema sennae]|uniref:hypothetical protein n=1 Tax=Brasilonema sennae TaxID=1397703 RepID=UPI00155AE5A3|nr:hypothetical protein [Brasilonema sennae]